MKNVMKLKKASTLVSILVFGSVFIMLTLALVLTVSTQNQSLRHKESKADAYEIAEAGLNFWKWYLAHNPADYTYGGTDTSADGDGDYGPYTQEYGDSGGYIGKYDVKINPNLQCNSATTLDVKVEGTSYAEGATHSLLGRYNRPSVAEFAYIYNEFVVAGDDRTVRGRYHSNGDVEMNGANDSLVTSAQTNGVYADPSAHVDARTDLWVSPVSSIDFNGITVDLVTIKDFADNQGGEYFDPSDGDGYRAFFKDDGTFDVYEVDDTDYHWAYNNVDGNYKSYERIASETFIANYTIPSDCSVIFFEDNLWISGEVDGKALVASADLINTNVDTTVYLHDDLTYELNDGSDGITVIAEEDVLITLDTPQNMDLRGIFIAQKGKYGREHYNEASSSGYCYTYWYSNSCKRVHPDSNDNVIQGTLTTVGSIVSNERGGTRWTSGGTTTSGYTTRANYYDRKLAVEPPPFTPYTSEEYRYIEWRDEDAGS